MLGFVLALAMPQEPVLKRQDETYLVARQTQMALTEKPLNGILDALLGPSAATYQVVPIEFDELDSISPVKRSVSVTASFIVGGKISHPPIDDDDDIVYFED